MASLLTTVDNPFNPHTNFDEWYAFDLRMGYDTCLLYTSPSPRDS